MGISTYGGLNQKVCVCKHNNATITLQHTSSRQVTTQHREQDCLYNCPSAAWIEPLGTRNPASTQGCSRSLSVDSSVSWNQTGHVLSKEFSSSNMQPKAVETTSVIWCPSGPFLNNSGSLLCLAGSSSANNFISSETAFLHSTVLFQLLNCHFNFLQRKSRSTGSPLMSNLLECQLVWAFSLEWHIHDNSWSHFIFMNPQVHFMHLIVLSRKTGTKRPGGIIPLGEAIQSYSHCIRGPLPPSAQRWLRCKLQASLLQCSQCSHPDLCCASTSGGSISTQVLDLNPVSCWNFSSARLLALKSWDHLADTDS